MVRSLIGVKKKKPSNFENLKAFAQYPEPESNRHSIATIGV